MKKPKPRRPVDEWRDAARIPFQPFKLSASKASGEDMRTIEEYGTVIGQWRHVDAPWLWDFIRARLLSQWGSWHVAQAQLRSVAGSKDGGKLAGKTKADNAKIRQQRIIELANAIGVQKREPLAALIEERDPELGKASGIVKKLRRR